MPLPTGTVTFLLTDIEGSTRLWEQHPDVMQAGLARHDALLSTVVTLHGGQVVKSRGEGDSLFAVFPRASDAVAAALTAQRALAHEAWPLPEPLRVRMAIHTGEAELRDGDYFGAVVNRCARLRGIGHGGQVLLSRSTHDLVRDALPGDAGLRDLGEHRLRDLARPEHVYQLTALDLPDAFPPLRSLDARPHNLPIQPTALIGREREVAEVIQMVRGEARLVTLTGPGGTGKTRLAVEATVGLLDDFADGVWLVELAPLADPQLVPDTVASVLGVREQPGQPLAATLAASLRQQRVLLVLDNCEHLVSACAGLAETLLRSCPQLTILATSREALRIAGERIYRVPPLAVPDTAVSSLTALNGTAAVRLFVERAAAVLPTFALTEQNAPAVVQICRRLDGVPLALELAAARLPLLSADQIAARLDDRFRLLTGGSRTDLPWRQTLRGTLDWSYDLLSEPERALLRRLTVFAGGWTLEAAEAVCGGDGIDGAAVLDLLGQLVDKSLVSVDEQRDATRYRLLETVRQYGEERLREAGQAGAVGERHALWYTALAEQAEPLLHGPDAGAWFRRLTLEHGNLRAALAWSLRPAAQGAEPERHGTAGLRLATALEDFWWGHGHLTEGRRGLTEALAQGGTAPAGLRARALRAAGHLAYLQGDYEQSAALLEAALALYQTLDDAAGMAGVLNRLGILARFQGDHEAARPYFKKSLALARSRDDKDATAVALDNLGLLAERQGDFDRARALLEESMGLFREVGDRRGVALALGNLAVVAFGRHEYARAAALGREALALMWELGDRWAISLYVQVVAGAALALGQPLRATRLLGAGERLREVLGVGQRSDYQSDVARGVAAMRAALGDDVFASELRAGRALSLEETIALALADTATA